MGDKIQERLDQAQAIIVEIESQLAALKSAVEAALTAYNEAIANE